MVDLGVGAVDAKTHILALLRRVVKGEEVLIARHGKPIARLIGAQATGRERVHAAVAGLLQLRQGATLGGIPWKSLRDEGR